MEIPAPRKVKTAPRKVKYPCGKCRKECISNCIACDGCNQWFHTGCECLLSADFAFLESTSLSYLCSSCCKTPDGLFDFGLSLKRLEKSVLDGNLSEAARLEKVLLRFYPMETSRAEFDNWGLSRDHVALGLLGQNWKGLQGTAPIAVSGDGNCLFNSLSMAIFGNQTHATELRVRTSIELCLNQEYYKRENADNRFDDFAPTLEEAVSKCPKNGEWACIWDMHAASTVIGAPIISVYPVVNGPTDETIRVLNRTLNPRESKNRQNPVTIMWSGPQHNPDRLWTANHFVPLLKWDSDSNHENAYDPNVYSLADLDDFPPLSRSTLSPPQIRVKKGRTKAMKMAPPNNDHTYIKQENPQIDHIDLVGSPSVDIDLSPPGSPSVDLDPSPRGCPSVDLGLSPSRCDQSVNSQNENTTEMNDSQSELDITEISVSHPYQNPSENGLDGKFLRSDSQLDMIKEANTDLMSIPKGIKENVFFLLNDDKNIARRNSGRYSDYPDDCGAWDSGKSVTKHDYFLQSPTGYQFIKRRKDGTYFKLEKKKEIDLCPQPCEDQIIKMTRQYSVLKRDPKYKRRITWFRSTPPIKIAFVEYVGSYPPNIPHGNSKKTSAPYRRLNLKQKSIIGEEVNKGSAPRVIKEAVRSQLPDEGISLKTAQNARYAFQKENDPRDRQNIADEILSVMNMVYEEKYKKYIREVLYTTPNKPPSVICYTNEQIISLKSAVANGGIIGIDRTFNTSACYITVLTFKNQNVLRSTTGEPPIMFGPIYLHWEASTHSYHRFLSHIQSLLGDIDTSKIVFGTDGEITLVNAVKTCFPYSTHTLCTEHLEKNVQHHLVRHMSTKESGRIVNLIFNREYGLLAKDSEIAYSEAENEILGIYSNTYLVRYLAKLRNSIFLARQKLSFIPKFWTNNNNESINNIIKLKLDWKPHEMPSLIKKMMEIEKPQTLNIRDALHNIGDFTLAPWAKVLAVTDEVWQVMGEPQKLRRLERCLALKNPAHSNLISASNANFNVPKVAKVAKKPGQTKRVKSCKTKTISNKKPRIT